MRLKRALCPHCQAQVEPSYRFCLACGEVLSQDELTIAPVEPAVPRTRRGKYVCWQCRAKLDTLTPACPQCGAELDKPRQGKKQEVVESNGIIGNISLPMFLLFLVFGVVLLGGGALTMSPRGGSSDGEGGGFSLPSIADIPIPRLFGDDQASAGDKPAGVVANAQEARLVSVADDGLIRIRIEGEVIEVTLAGMSPNFAGQCLGEKALARVRRILVDESILFVALDGKGDVRASSRVATQSLYIWQYAPETAKVRFANEELLGGGEVAFRAVELDESEPGIDLARAAERAETKGRGRYEPGACD